ncbi:DUF7882 family protein [Schumannella soli]|uniref:ATP-dependent DNA ligase n=1 Tax=Schumannella soli TaxID=2590779 RepID=A0A506Y4I9_9MICO|nr:ATP-dependent DNA ligase [Schumannella soli]TPW77506.1 ATP-dependent DNA ligase [Schumannella soli]
MGSLNFEDVEIPVDDRALAHLQVVILSRLRRGEAFAFSWRGADDEAAGRATVWLHPHAKIVFSYIDGDAQGINRHWVDALTEASFSSGGLHLVPEPEAPARRR